MDMREPDLLLTVTSMQVWRLHQSKTKLTLALPSGVMLGKQVPRAQPSAMPVVSDACFLHETTMRFDLPLHFGIYESHDNDMIKRGPELLQLQSVSLQYCCSCGGIISHAAQRARAIEINFSSDKCLSHSVKRLKCSFV